VHAASCTFFHDSSAENAAVYALWKVPDLLPAFTLKGGEVSHYILGGADLMFPGIRIPPEGLPSFQAGQPWSVKVPGNPAPIAVSFSYFFALAMLEVFLKWILPIIFESNFWFF
jgi:translation initiation factor 2D